MSNKREEKKSLSAPARLLALVLALLMLAGTVFGVIAYMI